MTWQEVIEDKSLHDLPYKIELNQWGQIVMSPASNRHSRNQTRIAILLEKLMNNGEAMNECSIDTPLGTKVADVAWLSSGFLKKHGYATPYSAAPEICAEVVFPSNSREEIDEKIRLYLSKGALEVWICDADGNIFFHRQNGAQPSSMVCPKFPNKI
jgi:Uma2 family endonuclease